MLSCSQFCIGQRRACRADLDYAKLLTPISAPASNVQGQGFVAYKLAVQAKLKIDKE